MDMKGKTVFITGSTDGVGRYVATQLAAQGAKLMIHGRDASRANAVIAEIKRTGGAAPVFYQADLSSLAEVRKLGARVLADCERLDVASREQQTPEGLAAFQKVEIEKWWPIIKSAGIGAQAQ